MARRRFLTIMPFLMFMAATVANGAPDSALMDRANQAMPEFLRDLGTLVSIDTPSGHGPGLDKMGDILVDQLKALGAEVEILPGPNKGGHNIVGVLQGTGKSRLLLLAHADTVFKVGTAAERPFKIHDGRAFGPGVADEKGGIVLGLYALKLLKERGYTHYSRITYLINCDEEVGSGSSKELIKKLAREHDFALCLEPGLPGDGVVKWRKGTARMTVEVKGKASHAGVAPEKGVNALVEAAHQVMQLRTLEKMDQGTSVSFTVFQAGDKLNVIPDAAVARADVRALDPAEFERLQKSGAEMVKNQLLPGAEMKFQMAVGRPPFPPNAGTEGMIAKAQSIYNEIGLALKAEGRGGASDGNYTAAEGCPTVDGLGIAGDKTHTAEEYLEVSNIAPRLYLLTRMLMELGAPK